MGEMVRSDKLTFCTMYLQPEAANVILAKLGEKGCVQFEDMTPELSAHQRYYITELCRCAEMERILSCMEAEIKKDNLAILPAKGDPPNLKTEELNSFEALLEKWQDNLNEMSSYQTRLTSSLLELTELAYVLTNIDPIIGKAEIRGEPLITKASAVGAGEGAMAGKLHVFTGVVRRSKAFGLETMLWRVSRGNIFFRPATADQLFEEPGTGNMVRKVAFVAICQGDPLKSLLVKICAGFHAHMYDCPNTQSERREMVLKINDRIKDLNQVIQKTKYHRCKQLMQISKNMENWLIRVKKSKAIYFCMNLFSNDITRKVLIGQCWIPTLDLRKIQDILDAAATKSGSTVGSFVSRVDTIVTPPTYHRTNKFTRGFQNLISAYGDAVYGELNPGLYTIITFPFLFAIMFGDCGHGLIMLSFAVWMVIREKAFLAEKSTNEIWNIFFSGRYVILLMSIFTMYTGFVYNDWFSKPLRLKPNYWINTYTPDLLSESPVLQLDPAGKTGQLYCLGVDPGWGFSLNKIMNENSLKMKLSIIIGIIHMMFGLWLSLFNHCYFKKYYAIFLEFIPQLAILTSLFVWLVALVFMKWLKYGPKEENIKLQPGCAPSILILFIDMCLFRGTVVQEGSECDAYMFKQQELVQKSLVLVALVSMPILLFGSPIFLVITNKRKRNAAKADLEKWYSENNNRNPDAKNKVEHHLLEKVAHYSESFGELMIHQGVHTIEYVLSTISHTASYLRLWALSLAHAQLSEMLWRMVLSQLALSDHTWYGVPKLFVVFAIWATFSLAILVVMEGLSAFLHTLRLHWVEFMSKFFIGGGTQFHPYSFSDIVYGENKEEKAMEVSCKKQKPSKQGGNIV